MFMWLVQPCLDFIHLHCKAIVQTSSIHLSYSLMKLFTCLLGKYPKLYSFYFNFSCFPAESHNKMHIIRCKGIPKKFLYCWDPTTQVLSHWLVLIKVLWLAYRAFIFGHWCHYKTEHDLVSPYFCLLFASIQRKELGPFVNIFVSIIFICKQYFTQTRFSLCRFGFVPMLQVCVEILLQKCILNWDLWLILEFN